MTAGPDAQSRDQALNDTERGTQNPEPFRSEWQPETPNPKQNN
jgi:hypothetical protein